MASILPRSAHVRLNAFVARVTNSALDKDTPSEALKGVVESYLDEAAGAYDDLGILRPDGSSWKEEPARPSIDKYPVS